MHYVIVSCSPQAETRSTSAFLAKAMKDGIMECGDHSAELFFLNRREKWEEVKEAIRRSQNILFVLPVYVECIPGIMKEFLEQLEPKDECDTTISFLVQGGFEEASQLRCTEHYLEKIPAYLNCRYGGTIVKGGLFGLTYMRSEKEQRRYYQKVKALMADYVKAGGFRREISSLFAGDEYYSAGMIFLSRLLRPLNRMVWTLTGRKFGIKGKITQRPYEV